MPRFRSILPEVEAEQFDPQRHPWPAGVKPWPDAQGFRPRDTSWGYIEILGGRLHVLTGDWIVRKPDGSIVTFRPADFRRMYEPVDRAGG